MALAQERGHWYDRQGNPVYEVPRADGMGMRPATLADAKRRNLFPGVTGISNIAGKPSLERWKREQVLLAALTLPRKNGEPEALWIKRVFEDSEEQARKAAEKGTKIHAAIESYFRDEKVMEYVEIVDAVADKVFIEYGNQDWLPEKSFICEYGYGCKIDLLSPEVIIDFKSKEFSGTSKKLAWDEHAMQLAANRMAVLSTADPSALRFDDLDLSICKCANVFVSTSVPGLVHIHEWTEEELDRAWKKFEALLNYWQADRNYKPVWD